MMRMSKNKALKMLVAFAMTAVMVLSLFAGIGAIWVNEDISEVRAGVGSYSTEPEEDDFVLLEIVPNESMAQMGYLVGGQEPVDLTEIEKADRQIRKNNKLNGTNNPYVSSVLSKWIESIRSDTPVIVEFDNLISRTGTVYTDATGNYTYNELEWEESAPVSQYGWYEKAETPGSGNYNLSYKGTEVTVDDEGYEFVNDQSTTDDSFDINILELSDDEKTEIFNKIVNALFPTMSAADKTTIVNELMAGHSLSDGSLIFADNGDLYVKTTEGNGAYSTGKYIYITGDVVGTTSGGLYSLEYMYHENGDYEWDPAAVAEPSNEYIEVEYSGGDILVNGTIDPNKVKVEYIREYEDYETTRVQVDDFTFAPYTIKRGKNTITVQYEGMTKTCTKTFDVTGIEHTLTVEYKGGDKIKDTVLEKNEFTVKLVTNNGTNSTSKTIPSDQFELLNAAISKKGDNKVTVKYILGEETFNVDVTVRGYVRSLSVVRNDEEEKLVDYEVKKSDIVVYLNKDYGGTIPVSNPLNDSDYVLTNPNNAAGSYAPIVKVVGENTFKVTYDGLEATFTVTGKNQIYIDIYYTNNSIINGTKAKYDTLNFSNKHTYFVVFRKVANDTEKMDPSVAKYIVDKTSKKDDFNYIKRYKEDGTPKYWKYQTTDYVKDSRFVIFKYVDQAYVNSDSHSSEKFYVVDTIQTKLTTQSIANGSSNKKYNWMTYEKKTEPVSISSNSTQTYASQMPVKKETVSSEMTYTSFAEDDPGAFVAVEPGTGHFDKVSSTETIPQYVGTFPYEGGTEDTVYLGEYNKEIVYDVSAGELPRTITENKTTIPTKDYNRYILVHTKATRTVYTYEIVAAPGSGNYIWKGHDYETNKTVTGDDYKNFFTEYLSGLSQTDFENLDAVLNAATVEEPYDHLLSYQLIKVDSGSISKLNNLELFKRYALGLAYVDEDYLKGEDTNDYIFQGWYLDPYGVNRYDVSAPVTEDLQLYAKWETQYKKDSSLGSIEVRFDTNIPAEAQTKIRNEYIAAGIAEDEITQAMINSKVENMPETIRYIASGSLITEPYSTPMLADYLFKGWYYDAECTRPYDYTSTLSMSRTLYARWEKLTHDVTYSFRFDKNTAMLNNAGFTYDITSWPVDIESTAQIAANGRYFTNDENNFKRAEPDISQLKCVDNYGQEYVFAGWYLTSDCSVKFDFNTNIPASDGELSDDGKVVTITLFARWIPTNKLPNYNIVFNTNEPASTSSSCTPIKTRKRRYGTVLEKELPVPVLEGNIASKIDETNVLVYTVTPDDLATNDGLELIKRANMIVLSETCDPEFVDLFKTYRKKTIFNKADSNYSKKTFVDKDLPWSAVELILSRMTGYYYDSTANRSTEIDTCPVLFDYQIYETAMSSSSSSKTLSSITLNLSNSQNVTVSNVKSSNTNAYKLYLMSQVANPMTLYNAYMKGNSSKSRKGTNNEQRDGVIAVNSTTKKAEFTSTSLGATSDTRAYWNVYTLIPSKVLIKDEWQSNENVAMGLVGFTNDITVSESTLRNRMMIYKYGTKGMAYDFASYIISGRNGSEFVDSLGEKAAYSTSDIMYYMINKSDIYENISKNLDILEIEPATGKHNDEYWFWYISHFVPNYTGNITATNMSNTEFVCNIADLNSVYDIIYIGTDTTGFSSYQDAMMPASQNGVTLNKTTGTYAEFGARKGYIYHINATTSIPTQFYKLKEVSASEDRYKIVSVEDESNISNYTALGYTNELDYIGTVPAIERSGDTLKISDSVAGYFNSVLGLSLTLNTGTVYEWDNQCWFKYSYDYYGWMVDRYLGSKNKTPFTIKTSAGDTLYWEFRTENSGNLSMWSNDDYNFHAGNIYLKKVLYKTETVNTGTRFEINGSALSSGTSVSNQWIFIENTNPNIIISAKYVYAHVGKEEIPKGTRKGIFNTSTTNTTDDTIDSFYFSGNDLTFAKYKELAEFVNNGFPVILSRFMFDGEGHIDERQIDKSSWMYKFVAELAADTDHSQFNWFKENEIVNDTKFLTALNNKSFELKVYASPTEYKEKKGTLTDFDIYINGDSSNGTSRINEKALTYDIEILSKDTGFFELDIYIDTNADGKYNETDERLDSLEIVNKETGRSVRYNRLEANVRYSVTRSIKQYAGAIPWKLKITDLNYSSGTWVKTDIMDERTGLSAIKVTDKEDIYLLQVISYDPNSSSSYTKDNNRVYLATDDEINKARAGNRTPISATNASTYFSSYITKDGTTTKIQTVTNTTDKLYGTIKTAGLFFLYFSQLQEYNVHVVRLNQKDFATKCALVKAGGDPIIGSVATSLYGSANKSIKWSDLNMLILGFADCVDDIDEDATLDVIENFVEGGRTVLFTHDTTSFVSTYNKAQLDALGDDAYWGSKINARFRKYLGMDRFGVMENKGIIENINYLLKKDKIVNSSTGKVDFGVINIRNSGNYDITYDTMFVTGKGQFVDENSNGTPQYLMFDTKSSSNTETLLDGTSKKVTTRILNQGMTNGAIPSGNKRTFYATKTNNGQIVSYPFDVGDTLELADETHPQYWQLNMEDDDIVVWYSLDQGSRTHDDNKKYYGVQNDGINNYYIYSKGNITYSGVGHRANMNENEVKLFVNTMVASYAAQVSPTEPEITNKDRSEINSKKDYLYVDFDASYEEGDERNKEPIGDDVDKHSMTVNGNNLTYYTKRVSFTLHNFSIILNKKMTVHYYPVVYDDNYKDANGNPCRVVLYDYPLELKTYNLNNSTSDSPDPAEIDDATSWSLTKFTNLGKAINAGKNSGDTYAVAYEMDATNYLSQYGILTNYAVVGVPAADSSKNLYRNYSSAVNKWTPQVTRIDGNNVEQDKFLGSSIVESLEEYYVDIPISDEYYEKVVNLPASYTYKGVDGNNHTVNINKSAFAISNIENSFFEVDIQVVMRWGRDQSVNIPLIGNRGVVFMRRGMFTLD